MKRFIRCLVFSCSALLTIASASHGGEVGRVFGRLAHLERGAFEVYPRTVSLIKDSARIITEVEKDQSFIFPSVPPGRYLLVIGEGHIVRENLDVSPDLTTALSIDFANPLSVRGVTEQKPGMHRVEDALFFNVFLESPPLVYPDKTFSGETILSEEEQRVRSKLLNSSKIIEKFKLKGLSWLP
jgi:hypothetical protein